MTFIIMLAAFLLSCIVLAAVTMEVVSLIWRPALAVVVGGLAMWFLFRFLAGLHFATHQTIAHWVTMVGLLISPLTFAFLGWCGWKGFRDVRDEMFPKRKGR